ncbi:MULTISPECIES: YceI family protein [Gulbenkiania]|uniref:Polyisoprenoid-binding periplasmic protein YceI n=1 Tax=Gulbenkiania indica TaxID=375574 RepID=A0A0K6GV30_9NEIS|nr:MULTISPECIES: YceI family protein [Gulbenkiania]CUA82567.1 Polyisoprenoid-binding periplasmic protein YceI [Gulbenkiania indica]
MTHTLLASALFAFAGAAIAAPVSYTIDPAHTYAGYSVNHLGLSKQSGLFTKVGGTVVVDESAKSGKVDVTIDAASLQTFLADRDAHLKGPEFFNVEKFPTLTFQSDKVVFHGSKPAEVQGKLTLLGVTRPVTLKLVNVNKAKNPMSGKETWGANATTRIKRSEFGMKAFLPAISDEVDLGIALEAVAQ